MELNADNFYKVIFEKFNEYKNTPTTIGGIATNEYDNSLDLAKKLLNDDAWDINGRLHEEERYYDNNPTLIMGCARGLYNKNNLEIFKLLISHPRINMHLFDNNGYTLIYYMQKSLEEIKSDIEFYEKIDKNDKYYSKEDHENLKESKGYLLYYTTINDRISDDEMDSSSENDSSSSENDSSSGEDIDVPLDKINVQQTNF